MPYPYLSQAHALVVLRATIALLFMAHAVVRLVNGSVAQFAAFLEAAGFPAGTVWVLAISAYEIVAGLMIAIGVGVRWWCGGLFAIAAIGIVLIHARLGWFVGEHGTGGVEYSLALMAALLVIAAADAEARRRDACGCQRACTQPSSQTTWRNWS